MRKPKGWYHRYEIVRRQVTFHPDQPAKDWWCIVKYYGRGKGAGLRYFNGDPGANATDDTLRRIADASNVTVPVYIVRDGQAGEPYFGPYYGQN
jgi:hypothetical protein